MKALFLCALLLLAGCVSIYSQLQEIVDRLDAESSALEYSPQLREEMKEIAERTKQEYREMIGSSSNFDLYVDLTLAGRYLSYQRAYIESRTDLWDANDRIREIDAALVKIVNARKPLIELLGEEVDTAETRRLIDQQATLNAITAALNEFSRQEAIARGQRNIAAEIQLEQAVERHRQIRQERELRAHRLQQDEMNRRQEEQIRQRHRQDLQRGIMCPPSSRQAGLC